MTIVDYEEIYRLWMATEGMGLNDRDDSKEGIRRFLGRNSSTCFVALEQDQIIGVMMAGHDGRRGYIYHAAVIPEKRNAGVGEALITHVIDALENEGIGKMALVVFKDNKIGNSFWQKMGFTQRHDLIYRNRSI